MICSAAAANLSARSGTLWELAILSLSASNRVSVGVHGDQDEAVAVDPPHRLNLRRVLQRIEYESGIEGGRSFEMGFAIVRDPADG
jgi:hypothetical protein